MKSQTLLQSDKIRAAFTELFNAEHDPSMFHFEPESFSDVPESKKIYEVMRRIESYFEQMTLESIEYGDPAETFRLQREMVGMAIALKDIARAFPGEWERLIN